MTEKKKKRIDLTNVYSTQFFPINKQMLSNLNLENDNLFTPGVLHTLNIIISVEVQATIHMIFRWLYWRIGTLSYTPYVLEAFFKLIWMSKSCSSVPQSFLLLLLLLWNDESMYRNIRFFFSNHNSNGNVTCSRANYNFIWLFDEARNLNFILTIETSSLVVCTFSFLVNAIVHVSVWFPTRG